MANLERDCVTEQEFQTRLIALADVVRALKIPDSQLGSQKVEGSLNRLEAALKTQIKDEADRSSAIAALTKLRAVNGLRRSVAHGGFGARADRLRAGQTLAIRYYPDSSWKQLWDQVRARTVEALEVITAAVRRATLE